MDESTQQLGVDDSPDLEEESVLNPDPDHPALVESIPGADGKDQAMFLMPSKKEFSLFGKKIMRKPEAQRLWAVYTSTRRRWFPFELYRIGELVYYEMKLGKLRDKLENSGGDIWYNENDEPVESPYYGIIDKFTGRRNRLISDLGLTRAAMVRENKVVGKKRAKHGNEVGGQESPGIEDDLIPK